MDDQLLEQDNIESTILPLLSICSLTSDYHTSTTTSSEKLDYSLILAATELPQSKTPQLLYLINDCQRNFEQEANILLNNGLSHEDVHILFNNYKQFLTSCYFLKADYFDPPSDGDLTNYESWIFDQPLSSDHNTTINATTFDSLSSLDNTEANHSSSLSYRMSDFELERAAISMSSSMLKELSPSAMEFCEKQLYGVPESSYSNIHFLDDSQSTISPSLNSSKFNLLPSSIDLITMQTNNLFSNGRRKRPTKEHKALLESLFSIKSFPNATERKLIAEKCNMTPSQVRIWFTNKRARRKEK